ncbi:MAG: hypothetical protein MJ252_29025, partial [archaeon]|nr:hypothetical protein [archaeon]
CFTLFSSLLFSSVLFFSLSLPFNELSISFIFSFETSSTIFDPPNISLFTCCSSYSSIFSGFIRLFCKHFIP